MGEVVNFPDRFENEQEEAARILGAHISEHCGPGFVLVRFLSVGEDEVNTVVTAGFTEDAEACRLGFMLYASRYARRVFWSEWRKTFKGQWFSGLHFLWRAWFS